MERWIDDNFDALLRDTQRLISFQTVSGGSPEEERRYRQEIPACMTWLKELAEANGLAFRHWNHEVAEIEWVPEGLGDDAPIMGIASHIDVVTPNVGKWSVDPFKGEIRDGALVGRGIQDDKGPLMQALYGLLAARAAGATPPCRVRFIVGTREETGDWTDVKLYLAKRGAPTYTFTPDAEFPLITGEKGMANVRITAEWPKPAPHPETHMEFVSFVSGKRNNIVPDLAEVLLRFPVESKTDVMKELVRETTRFTVENPGSNVTLVPNNEEASAANGYYESLVSFIGKAAHSSHPTAGHNAATDALRFFADIETLPPSVRAFIQFLAFASAETDGTNLAVAQDHDFVGATTAVLTLLEVGPQGGWAVINIRPTVGLTAQEVIDRVRAAAETFTEATGLIFEVEPEGVLHDAIFLDPDQPGVGPFLASLRKAYELATGEDAPLVAVGGTTYAKAFPNACAFGPIQNHVDPELAHQADERMSLDSIRRNALVYGLSVALMGQV